MCLSPPVALAQFPFCQVSLLSKDKVQYIPPSPPPKVVLRNSQSKPSLRNWRAYCELQHLTLKVYGIKTWPMMTTFRVLLLRFSPCALSDPWKNVHIEINSEQWLYNVT